MAEAGKVSLSTYGHYVRSERPPDFMAGANWYRAGVDVLYVITGERLQMQLSADDQELLKRYHAAPLAVKAAVLSALTVGPTVNAVKQSVEGDVGQQVRGGNITNAARTSFNFGKKEKKP
ncbi:hypothetical protein BGZ97_004136 [Linnemannia gamsii]|uniref:Uncharacterized protein n=1 Tax=Linnemannia gamsii TaxID=64522 RepID=A0A9P6RIS7_9FUNG|nr:hypothetical protein BGZ97_004136 [Linnemannia gamsii]